MIHFMLIFFSYNKVITLNGILYIVLSNIFVCVVHVFQLEYAYTEGHVWSAKLFSSGV